MATYDRHTVTFPDTVGNQWYAVRRDYARDGFWFAFDDGDMRHWQFVATVDLQGRGRIVLQPPVVAVAAHLAVSAGL